MNEAPTQPMPRVSSKAQVVRQILTAVAVVALAGGAAAYVADTPKRNVREFVKDHLKDPDSARFKDIAKRSDGSFCGFVNARNGAGGYTGWTEFAVATWGGDELQKVYFESQFEFDDRTDNAMVRAHCW